MPTEKKTTKPAAKAKTEAASKNGKPYEMHVIPNTHWDREWTYGYQETRMLLIDFIDDLLKMLESKPNYWYLMDSQTVPVEDYLEVRPENRKKLEKFISNGQLEVGPWYTAPEEHNINGESIVRNLVMGHRLAKEFGGKPMKVGYSPFGYGQASQMPQIYQGFKIDTTIFYRGIGTWDTPRSEFIWEGPDGSRVLGSRLGSKARYNFYFNVWRPIAYGMYWGDRQYFWDMEGLPFHLCNDQDYMGHFYLVDPQKKYRKEKLVDLILQARDDEKQHHLTRHLGFLHGMDSTAPDPIEFEILADAQKEIKDDKIYFSSLSTFMTRVKEEVDWDSLEIKYGERRHPGPSSPGAHIWGDVVSSRPIIKMLNTRTENALQRWAEPFTAFSWLLGAEYPYKILEIAWKNLLINHPHDSISGSGVDQLEKDMVYRFEQVQGISDGVLRRALQNIQLNVDNSDLDKREIALTVINPSPYSRTEMLTAVVDIDERLQYGDFSLFGTDGNKVPIHVTERHRDEQVVRNLIDVTLALIGQRVTFQFMAENIPALGYKTYIMKPEGRRMGTPVTLTPSLNTLENEYLRVCIDDDGTLEMLDEQTGQIYENLHYFVDEGEAGHAWQHLAVPHDKKINSVGCPIEITLVESTPFKATYSVTYKLQIPAGVEYLHKEASEDPTHGWHADKRTSEMKEYPITSFFTLRKGAKALEVKTVWDNNCRNHRLRVFFPTGIAAKTSNAEAAFDVVQRDIDRPEGSPFYETPNPTHPHYRFVEVNDGKAGFAVLNDGLREYEVTDNEDRAIAVTLLRSYMMSLCTVTARWEVHPEQELAQCIGPQERRYAIYPHAGDWARGEVFHAAENFNLPVKIAQVGRHKGKLPKSLSFMELEGAGLVFSGVKQAENGKGLIVRLFNPTDKAVKGSLKFFKPIKKAQLVSLEEIPEKEIKLTNSKTVPLSVAKKKIVTLELEF
ncbi:MAG: glycoside hydrolase family 38 C-terminal domain-containing protein [Armatimonadota bacterium]|nr:glycoside hydrolase family 38 C-terminal domain-containing protein [Armatimonadota bacterium]